MHTWLAVLLSCLSGPWSNLVWRRPVLTAGQQTVSPECLRCCNGSSPSACPPGSYFMAGVCVECPAGHVCLGNSSAPRKCDAGTYNVYTRRGATADCQPCPPGSISTDDRAGCRPCPAGVSCDWLTGAVTPCLPGQHSPEGHTHCLPCSPGFVCVGGQQRMCGPGEGPDQNQTQCTVCPAGFYSTGTSGQCHPCPAGTYCPRPGMVMPRPCPSGQYSEQPGQRQCLNCNRTSRCGLSPWSKTSGQLFQRSWALAICPPGTYRGGDGDSTCLLCSSGHYCQDGVEIQCPVGTYGAKDGLQRESDCMPCPAGFFCLEGTPKRPGSQFMCPQGYYCEEGTATPHGTPCPAGTAGTQLGQTSKAACRRCAEGRFCPAGSVFPGLSCAKGRFCPAGTLEEVICPKGTFTPHQGATSVKDCLKCPPGFYCPEGTSDPMPCHPGTFNPLEGQDEAADCRACYAGKACTQAGLKAPDVDCMQGFTCPPGSSRPNTPSNACPPGTLSDRTDLMDRSQCQTCPSRYACPRGTGGAQRPALPCLAGHYCPPGTMFPTQHKCPAGTWSQRSGLESEAECGLCPRGWYCMAGAGAPSGRCSSGHYCPEGTQYGSQFPCPAGTYSTRVGNVAREDCLFCPEGAYCPQGSSKPTPCPPTTFRREKGGQQAEDCSVCPAGYFCPHASTIRPSPCGAGSYSAEGSAVCLPCQRGHYCSNDATSQEAMLSQMVCPAGLLCSQGLDREPQRSSTLCPKGFYCPGGSVDPNPIPCPNGTYGSQAGLRKLEECTTCPAGHFCFSLQPQSHPLTEPTGSCPDGYYCPAGTGNPHSLPCQAGFYRNESQRHPGEVCMPCPSGYFCARLATHTPTVCPKGFFCMKGSVSPLPCEEGTFGSRQALHSAFECTPCGGGRYCRGVGRSEPSGDCEEGFFCRGRAQSPTPAGGPTGGPCPPGSFCPVGSSVPSPCPPGTLSNRTGLGSIKQCGDCPPGFYCSGSNNSAPTGQCAPGYYCTGGSVSPLQHEATEGHFTQAGAAKAEPCPFGFFQPARAQSSCLECQRGRLCNQTGLARPPLCPPGHFCPSGSTLPHPCPPGTYLGQVGGESVQHCGPCDAGMFCRNPGLLAPQGACSPGFFCLGGASTATPVNSSAGDVCPVGYYCPSGTRHPRENPCAPGTWSSATGARDAASCWLCPAGFFCNGSGLIQPSGLCAPGFYCSGGAKSSRPVDGVTGNRCPVGYHCPQGSTSPLNCQDGTYSNTTGAAECLDCPAGRYCPLGVEVRLCPAGHYCLGGSREEDVLPCPPGTYNPVPGASQLEQCRLCPAGMFCEDWGQAEPTGPCQAGYFCLAGINFRNPDGNISTGVGGACPRGHYCPAGTSLPVPCPLGHFSDSVHVTELSGCRPCPPGWFCGSVGLVRPTGLCREGFYCPGRDSSPTGPEVGAEHGTQLGLLLRVGSAEEAGLCPVAHYCPVGSAIPTPCPAGTYTNLSGQAECFRCPAGYYCPEKTSNYTWFPCLPGFYCPDGTKHSTQYPCPRGYYNPEPMTQSLDSCLPCPPGHYCEKERLTSVSGKCKAGWFCVSAAWSSQPFDLDNYTNANCLCPATSTGGKCQEGYFCPTGSSEPQPCLPGAFCNSSGLAQPAGPCSPGYYCTGSATHPKPTDGITGDICPPGAYCGEGSTEPKLCPAGTFSPMVGLPSKSHCWPCTPGFYCGTAGLLAPTAACYPGYWCPPGQTSGMAVACPMGHHCPPGSPAPVPCPMSSYQDREKQATCKPCEPGYYCDTGLGPANTSSLRPCPRGHYCPLGTGLPQQYKCPPGTFNPREGADGISSCLLCPAGKFCPGKGLAEPAGDCHAGFWCRKASITPTPMGGEAGEPCPVAHYCPRGTASPRPCPVGSWSNSTGHKSQAECQACPGGFYCGSAGLVTPSGPCAEGFYCLEGAVTPNPTDGATGGPCPREHYCPVGTPLPVPCEPGTFMAATHATQCRPCPPGMYCLNGTVLLCPAGFYCPEAVGYDWKACPEGTYSPDQGLIAVSQCRQCDGGHYCPHRNATAPAGLCCAGHYCVRGNISPQPHPHRPGEGGPCPVGYYCHQGTTDPLPCPEGTFSNLTKRTSRDDCVLCPLGHYCHTVGLTMPSGECWEGFYCQQGAMLPNSPIRDSRGGACPAGHFCPRGSAYPQPCPEGSISTEEGQAHCSPCTKGFYCPRNSSSYESHECPAGYYCPTGTSSKDQYPCPAGTFNPHMRAGGLHDCLVCTPGLFCGSPGLSAPSGPCAAGYFCQAGSSAPSPEGLCPPGHYCPKGSASARPCPPGSYSNTSGNSAASDCLPCTPGFSCVGLGQALPSQACQAGHYCPSGQTASLPCSPGYMCPLGSSTETPCAPGTYQDRPAQAECLRCPAGHFCVGQVVSVPGERMGAQPPTPCPKGHYCPAGSSSAVEFPCPPGTLGTRAGLASSEACEPCPPGTYCSAAGLSAPMGECSPGYLCIQGAVSSQPAGGTTGRICSPGFFCPQGTSHMLPCPPGTFNPSEGAPSVDSCIPCPPGRYCAGFGLDSPSGGCRPGHYCILGAQSPVPELNSTGRNSTRFNFSNNITPFWRQAGGDVCPRGHYCPRESPDPKACPPGTFLDKYGAKSVAECEPCSPGFYCPHWGQSSASHTCPEGWYCPGGSGLEGQSGHQCPQGHACPSGSAAPALCPSGFYQSLAAQPACRPCPPGYFCVEGSSTPKPCPMGTLGSTAGLGTLHACSPCPPGSFCRGLALIQPTGPCTAGHYCSLGATGPEPISQDFGDLCPLGHFCPEGSSAPVPCPAGTYLPEKGAPSWSYCSPCPPGQYCQQPGSQLPSGPCSHGYYCPGSSSTSTPQASPWHAHCLYHLATEHEQCTWGYNCTFTFGITEGGTVTPQNTTDATCAGFQGDICPKGFYCPRGSAFPHPCDQGLYCDWTGLSGPAGSCAAGYFCPQGSIGPQASLCPKGHYCPSGSSHPLPCPHGTLRDSMGGSAEQDCLPCPHGHFCAQRGLAQPSGLCAPGYYCPEGQRTARPPEHVCRAGRFCVKGSPGEMLCGPGSYQASKGQSTCDVCPAGYFCPEQAMTHPIPCHKGFYCPPGTANQHPCPPGSYGNHSGLTEASDCTPCVPGMYCKGSGSTSPTGACTAGFLCFGGASLPAPTDGVAGVQCPSGFYCPVGSSAPSSCPKGTFSEQPGLTRASQCRNCSPGFYCAEVSLTAVSGPCLPGFFCLEGSKSANPVAGVCSAGYYCKAGSAVPKPCPAGTHRAKEGGQDRGDCEPCPDGWFQSQEGQTKCQPCPPGHHCPGSTTAPLLCPAGHFCQRGISPCPRGYYSPARGLTSAEECLPCPEGFFCGSAGLVHPTGPCSPGFLCVIASQVSNPTDNLTGSACPRGAYCQLGVVAGSCSPGYYCDWGSSSPEQSLCPAGFYCPSGTDWPVPCPTGMFSTQLGNRHQEDCAPCPAGSICQGTGEVQPLACPLGHYCPLGTAGGAALPCPPGTVRADPGASSQEDCQPCPAGMFCALRGQATPTGPCQSGYYCSGGARSSNSTRNSVTPAGTDLCPPGHYCPTGSPHPVPCPPGSYSSSPGLSREEQCQLCPSGFFCDRPALLDVSEAILCDAGYVCLEGSVGPRPTDGRQGYLCPSGYSCPLGTPLEVPCEPGSFSPTPGLARCLTCPAGTVCGSPASQLPTPCPAGHYCPSGTASALPCPSGTTSRWTGAQDSSTCVPCPTGLYCRSPGSSEPQGKCQQGYFCRGGASSPAPESSASFPGNGPCPLGHYCPAGTLTPVPCPAGSIRNLTGGSSLESCMPCPPGYYCASEGQDSPSGPCSAGFYCPTGYSSVSPEALPCPQGHYCPEGIAFALPCPAGTYQPNPTSDSCSTCPHRFYCPTANTEDPLPCPPHSYCPAGTEVPQLCPNGTFTPPGLGGLQDDDECSPCPPGRFCRVGRIQGLCAAGFLCLSGSSEFAPQGAPPRDCRGEVECAGPCPAGYYCKEGAEEPQPCPPHTLRTFPGASSRQYCLSCPPQHWCREGDPTPYPCPAGHYCDGLPGSDGQEGAGPKECPTFTYRSTPRAGSKGECQPCPPGYLCNSTGLVDYRFLPCPPGFWCSGVGPPVPCPAGSMRPQSGAATPAQCQPCTPGNYCPDPRHTGRPNVQGVPCRASYHCPPGTMAEIPCKAGFFCGPVTGEPMECPAGYFCPEGSGSYAKTEQVCRFPFYCPPRSPLARLCDGGFWPLNTSGLRTSRDASCAPCEAGTHRPGLSPATRCLPCPAGYHCPPGTEYYWTFPCPLGYVCPLGSATPVPCPLGFYGNSTKAETLSECQPCPAGTFNHLSGQRACFPCGSSSFSPPGAASCTCFGQNRVFQHSDGSCLCRTGFVFYNTLDHRISESDSLLDCQPEVNERCATGQARLASTRECVTLSLDLCDATCGSQGGALDVQLGICRCEHYVSTEELCNASCISKLPHVSARLAVDGQLVLMLGGRDGRRSRTMMIQNILGPDVHMKATGNVYFAQFDADGVFGWIMTNEKLIDTLLSGSVKNVYRESSWRIDTKFEGLSPSSHLPRVPNPLTCLSPNDMLIFQLTITYSDRHLSHFPVYQKDHLFSTNPAWDFGAFRRLGQLIKHSRFNITWFAHVFSEPGTYVFLDNGMPAWSLVVVVSDRGVECDPGPFRPSSPEQLVRLGVKWQRRPNLLPDRATIAGVLGSVGLLIAVLIASALFLDFRRRGMIVLAQYKPRWRSLGEPRLHAEYSQRGPALLGCRGAAEGAEAEETLISRGGYKVGRLDLEEFNVRTLYDKLEDQSLHLASQLACYRKETQEFYKNIQQQADALKDLILNMDAVKVGHMKDMLALNTVCSDPGGDWTAERDGPTHGEEIQDPAVPVLGVFLRALGALLSRNTGECWPQQDAALHLGGSAVRVRSTQDLHNPLQLSVTNMTGHQPAEEMKSDSANLPCTAPCLSENDFSRFVALTPLSRTLQEIQESLQNLPHPEEDTSDDSVESPKGRLVPWALDRLSPQHFAVFLFGCDIVRRLCDSHGFPRVTLLLAQTVPVSRRSGPEGPCCPDFHYDPDNQILYLCKATLEDVGQFTATLLHSMAYVGSADSTSSFMGALHRAVSALGLPLFYASFTKRHDHTEGEAEEGAIGSVFDDILSLTIPVETHFTEQLLAERLQKFKYFQLRQHLRDLKTQATNGVGDEPGPKGLDIQEQEYNVEQEIDRLNSLFLYLSARLLEGGEMSRRTQEQEEAGKNSRQAGGPFWAGAESGLSRGSTLLLTLRRHCVARRLSDMHRRLTQIRLSQDSTLQPRGQEAGTQERDDHIAGTPKAGGHRPGLQASSHATSEVHASHDPMQELQIPGDPMQELQIPGDPMHELQIPGDPMQELQIPGDPMQELQIPGDPTQELQSGGQHNRATPES